MDGRELAAIGRTEKLELATLRDNGMLRPYVTIWVVRTGDELCVPSARGVHGGWYVRTRPAPGTRAPPRRWPGRRRRLRRG
ncbi:hypothetical protein GCM10010435_41710 [Winogradskya consettensis]|uniref:DUF2255 family protein n=1 Tax=Winogradskya consettensis TaxID=113560 RepID=UPI001BB341C0|nr:DUF2255 family protein [Actinoplanes consettensis]